MPNGDSSTKPGIQFAVQILLRATAISGFLAYCAWNIYWLAQGMIPPSIFFAVTGLPAPTTGGTRAVMHISQGNLRESLRYNAMAVPILLLLAVTVAWLGCQTAKRRRMLLPFGFFWAWLIVLVVAWVLKLSGDPLYW